MIVVVCLLFAVGVCCVVAVCRVVVSLFVVAAWCLLVVCVVVCCWLLLFDDVVSWRCPLRVGCCCELAAVCCLWFVVVR